MKFTPRRVNLGNGAMDFGWHPFSITHDDKLPHLLDEVARRHRPSASAISVAVNDLSDFCAAEVRSLLDCTYGAIYLALDAWMAPNGIKVLGVLAFFKAKAGSTELLEHVVLLDFVVLVNTHSGKVLARVVHELCNEYGILNKVMGIASDNTSNMGRMMDELGEYGLGKDQTIFAYFDSTTESRFTDPRPESTGEDPSVKVQHQSLNTCVIWFSDDDTAEDTLTQKNCKATEQPGRQMKLAELKVKDRGVRGQQAAADAQFIDMMDRALEDIYWEVHMRVESGGHGEDEEEVDHSPTREETSSNHYTRSSTKWMITKAQKLAEWCHYNCVIRLALFTLLNLSSPQPPHPHLIYPAIKTRWNSRTEKIQTDPKYNIKKEKHLNRFLNDSGTVPTLHNAIIVGLEKLFDYYGKTGDCPYYATAIRATRYLKHQKWPQVWIDDAIEATQALYNTRHLDKARAARSKAQDCRALLSTTTKSIFGLLDEDDEDDIDLDLDNFVCNFVTTKHARVNAAGQPISALDYWKRQYAAGEMNGGLMDLACPRHFWMP
ncbi:hypothetical protein JCM1841_003685, partial [Sporobolomyces salmonicolor]